MNTKEGAEKARKTLINKYGSEEAYLAHMREIAAISRMDRKMTTFYRDRGLAKRAGKLSKRGKGEKSKENKPELS